MNIWKKIEKEVAWKLTQKTQEQMRKQGVRLRQKGKTFKEIGEIIGVHINTVWKWWQKYKAEGVKAIEAKKRGRREGTNRSLNAEQEVEIQKLISNMMLVIQLSAKRQLHQFKEWLANHVEEIEVFHLPAYSPELNPDEYLNCDLKAGVHSKPPARDTKGLKNRVKSHMIKLQKLPARVANHFKHSKIVYAS